MTTAKAPDPIEHVVAQAARGERFDRYLADLARGAPSDSRLASLSRAHLQKLIERGAATIDGQPARAAYKLRGGERICVDVPAPEPLGLVPEAMALEVLYEDDDLIAINKPAGLAVHPGAGRTRGTLVNALLAHCRDLSGIGGVERPGIVHRLDRGTTGVLVVAKNDVAHQGLAGQFARRETEKRYVAFVLGALREPRGTFDTPYGRHRTQRRRFTSRLTSGKRAVTHYTERLAVAGLTCVEVRLETGRTHQIRVHFAEHGHPIVGDPLYGGRKLEGITEASLRAIAAGLEHQALHAARLVIRHPRSDAVLRFDAPLSPPLQALWDQMQRLSGGR